MTFVHCQFKACLLGAFEGCSQVDSEVVSVIGSKADVVHILSTLVRLDDFIKVLFQLVNDVARTAVPGCYSLDSKKVLKKEHVIFKLDDKTMKIERGKSAE